MHFNREDPAAAGRWLRRMRLLMPAAVLAVSLLSWLQARSVSEALAHAGPQLRQAWESQPPRFPLEALAQSWVAPVKPSPLASFDPGEGAWLGTSYYLQLGRSARTQDQLGFDYFAAGRQREASPALLLQLFLPLLAVLLLWRDRQLPAAGRPAPLRQLVELIELAAPSLAIAILASAGLNASKLGLDGAIRLLLLLAVYLVYGAAAWGIARLASRMFPTGAVAALALFWLFQLGLARPLAVNAAAAFQPLPSLEEFVKLLDFETRMGYLGADPRSDRERRFAAEALRDYKVGTIAELPVNLSAIIMAKEERHQREIQSRRVLELWSKIEAQDSFERWCGFLFPSVAIQNLSTALAGVDSASQRWQLGEANRNWDRLVSEIYTDVIRVSGPEGEMKPVARDYWRRFAILEPNPAPATFGLGNAMISLGALLFWLALGLFLGARKEAA
jgi:ABC-2 type transport system permease protein